MTLTDRAREVQDLRLLIIDEVRDMFAFIYGEPTLEQRRKICAYRDAVSGRAPISPTAALSPRSRTYTGGGNPAAGGIVGNIVSAIHADPATHSEPRHHDH